ncbi:MAG: tRNA (N(6)-L-threonylcarbamoyladenosine(37)-C(2))-methylthiotransferase [Candidatus Heimdallarchaeota archaeon]|nr:tRNA (N(6)-L-threonylcarbamoyladenosine(37)-C(2))-methylthiotransferase [Candidatus Heimdallarchaeota archaeon]
MAKFFIETFGCTANASASELMGFLLTKCGYEKIDTIKKADFVLVNTCIVKAPTESKIKNLLMKLYEKIPLIVTGCLPQVLIDWCHENIPTAALLGVDHFGDVCLAAKQLLSGKPFELLSREKHFCEEIQRDRSWRYTGIIEISKGCLGQCAYCIVKIAKGSLVSKFENQILSEAKAAIKEGCKELWLTAQDTASYGFDLNTSLPKLVQNLTAIPGDFMIRVGMMNIDFAKNIIDEIIEFLKHPKVYAFIHIPLQSGSNDILEKMKRRYTVEEFWAVYKKLQTLSEITISTDIITGFPGETEDDFQKTKELLQTATFDIINISKYGDRKGTYASKSTEKIPTEIIKKRSKELTVIQNQISLQQNEKWIGWEGKAIALRPDNVINGTLCRNKAYKTIAIKDSPIQLGDWYKVKIIGAQKTRLIGKLID